MDLDDRSLVLLYLQSLGLKKYAVDAMSKFSDFMDLHESEQGFLDNYVDEIFVYTLSAEIFSEYADFLLVRVIGSHNVKTIHNFSSLNHHNNFKK